HWLIAIAKNVLLETMRHASASRSSGPLPDQSSILGKVPDSVTTLTRAVARKEDVQRMLAIIETLEEDDRSLVLGHGLEGLTLPEIAARLGVRVASPKRSMRDAFIPSS
ncbi:MAG: sigma factor-like helix-turn-helix DNA-binding protein, partial [Planctomycetota bacterium]